jgi:predicted nuclease of predicted toxin-antitoxin system
MKFLLDQDVYVITARFLVKQGHDVLLAAQLGLSQASDTELLKTAKNQDRIMITRDRDYGGLVFVNKLGSGLIYLRMTPSTQNAVHHELETILTTYSEDQIKAAFIVVEPGGHRFRKLSNKP